MLRSLFLVVFIVLSGPAFAQKVKLEPAPRTFLDTLDLTSPEKTAASFLDAYAASDYLSAYYILSWQARHGFGNAVGSFDLSVVFPGVTGSTMPGSTTWSEESAADLRIDMMSDIALVFDDLMYAAERNGTRPFVLRDPSVGSVERLDGDAAVLVVSNPGGRPSALEFGMTILSDGTWRIDRIMWDGSDTEGRPWGILPAN